MRFRTMPPASTGVPVGVDHSHWVVLPLRYLVRTRKRPTVCAAGAGAESSSPSRAHSAATTTLQRKRENGSVTRKQFGYWHIPGGPSGTIPPRFPQTEIDRPLVVQLPARRVGREGEGARGLPTRGHPHASRADQVVSRSGVLTALGVGLRGLGGVDLERTTFGTTLEAEEALTVSLNLDARSMSCLDQVRQRVSISVAMQERRGALDPRWKPCPEDQ